MEGQIKKINACYNEGMQYKNIARKGVEFFDSFFEASKSYFAAAHGTETLLRDFDNQSFDFETRANVLKNYYFYEAYECQYAYLNKTGVYDAALNSAKSAEKHILEAIKLIDESLPLLTSGEIKEFLISQRKNYTLSQLTIKLKVVEPKAKKAMEDHDYVTALDAYTQMGELQDKVYEYTQNSELDQVHKRIEKGNYFGSKASIAMTIAGIYSKKSPKNNYKKEMMEQFLQALHYSELAQNSNPEQDIYKNGSETTKNNIAIMLNESKSDWLFYLTEFPENKNLTKIMKQTNLENFKLQAAKLEIEKDKPKRFLLTFGFLLSGFLIIGYFFFYIALSQISWFRFLAVLVCLPVAFTVVGAFALRATDSLKEENFLKLMQLAFKMNLKGLNALNQKITEKEN